ncbi:MAG: hypothetical protein OXN86_14440 [Chloroflexota bacterium]|nr:hypothetical protein [Chloroflexota bacterium]
MQRLPSAEQIEAVREYLRTRAWWRGAQGTADQYGVSRSTLWRFLWTDHVSPKLLAAAIAEVGASTWELRRAAERLRPPSVAAGVTRATSSAVLVSVMAAPSSVSASSVSGYRSERPSNPVPAPWSSG